MNVNLISREALLSRLVNLVEYDEGGWEISVPAVKLEDIEELPFVDAEPVRHGAWIDGECSVCKKCITVTIEGEEVKITDIKANYCPNCGAKMDREE